MTTEYETFREVGIGFGGVQKQLNIYGGVFAVAVALGGYALIFSKIDKLEDTTARIEERLAAMDATLQKIAGSTDATKAGIDQVLKRSAAVERTTLPEGWKFSELLIASMVGNPKLVSSFFIDGDPNQLKDPTSFKASYEALNSTDKVAVDALCAPATTHGSDFCKRLSDSRM